MKKIKKILPFYVLNWSFNSECVEHYDIMPYLINKYKKIKKSERPVEFEDIKQFILRVSRYQFWSRCEYEIIISDWPANRKSQKIDIFEQIEMNIDTITNTFLINIINGKV